LNVAYKKEEMVKKLFFSIVLVMVVCCFAFMPKVVFAEGYSSDKKASIEQLVDEAAGLIEAKGEEAISIIKDKKGKFYTEDTYIFITSADTGADLVNPAFEVIEGIPAENYFDSDAWAAQMIIVGAVKDKDTAWVEYFWPKPGEEAPSRKVSFLRKIIINGKTRIIGAGFYPDVN